MNLIFYPKNELKPVGGSAGYLYNLSKGIDKDDGFEFLPDSDLTTPFYSKYKKYVPKFILEYRRALALLKNIDTFDLKPEKIENYKCIHFHSTLAMYKNRKWLDEYKGKVVLTSHSPCALHYEMIDQIDSRVYKLLKTKLDSMVKIDEYAFNRADYIIFPTAYSEEPYFNTWKEYRNIRDVSKIKYMPSGIIKCSVKKSREEIRKQYGIPQNAFVVSYVGRHNEIKGFDVLKEIGKELIHNNIWILVAGKNEPIQGLKDEHWVEVGWTNDPHSIMAASDIFVLPNRETYFDLVLLEAISLGIQCVISNTGGNKYFRQYKGMGIEIFDSIDEAKNIILNEMSQSEEYRCQIKLNLENIFEETFAIKPFADRYKKIMEEIVK